MCNYSFSIFNEYGCVVVVSVWFLASVTKPHSKKSGISALWKHKKSKSKGKTMRMFGAPLNMVIINNELPDILQVCDICVVYC